MYGTDLESIYKQYQNDKRNITPLEEEKNLENFGIAFTYDSNRIEGGSLTKNETKALILHDQAPRRPLKDILETKAHYKLIKKIREEKRVLNLGLVLEWHYTMFKDTDEEIAGKIREKNVMISGSELQPPSPVELEPLLIDLFEWYEKKKEELHTVELAMVVHYKFVSIHPFMDGNGRITRLLMNYILNRYEYPMYNIRNQERSSYYKALARADKRKDAYMLAFYLTKKYTKICSKLRR